MSKKNKDNPNEILLYDAVIHKKYKKLFKLKNKEVNILYAVEQRKESDIPSNIFLTINDSHTVHFYVSLINDFVYAATKTFSKICNDDGHYYYSIIPGMIYVIDTNDMFNENEYKKIKSYIDERKDELHEKYNEK
jgi:hypothetical protein